MMDGRSQPVDQLCGSSQQHYQGDTIYNNSECGQGPTDGRPIKPKFGFIRHPELVPVDQRPRDRPFTSSTGTSTCNGPSSSLINSSSLNNNPPQNNFNPKRQHNFNTNATKQTGKRCVSMTRLDQLAKPRRTHTNINNNNNLHGGAVAGVSLESNDKKSTLGSASSKNNLLYSDKKSRQLRPLQNSSHTLTPGSAISQTNRRKSTPSTRTSASATGSADDRTYTSPASSTPVSSTTIVPRQPTTKAPPTSANNANKLRCANTTTPNIAITPPKKKSTLFTPTTTPSIKTRNTNTNNDKKIEILNDTISRNIDQVVNNYIDKDNHSIGNKFSPIQNENGKTIKIDGAVNHGNDMSSQDLSDEFRQTIDETSINDFMIKSEQLNQSPIVDRNFNSNQQHKNQGNDLLSSTLNYTNVISSPLPSPSNQNTKVELQNDSDLTTEFDTANSITIVADKSSNSAADSNLLVFDSTVSEHDDSSTNDESFTDIPPPPPVSQFFKQRADDDLLARLSLEDEKKRLREEEELRENLRREEEEREERRMIMEKIMQSVKPRSSLTEQQSKGRTTNGPDTLSVLSQTNNSTSDNNDKGIGNTNTNSNGNANENKLENIESVNI